jgi:hypothetical protein
MESLNLNGRVVGKTDDGKILVALTVEEYLDALPPIAVIGNEHEEKPQPVMAGGANSRGARTQAAHIAQPKVPRQARQKPAEKPAPLGKADKGTRICVVCGNPFAVRRKDQKTCGGDCKVRHSVSLAKDWRARGNAKKPTTPAAPPPKVDKTQRLDAIREAARRVNARHEEEGSSLHVAGAGAADPATSGQGDQE